LLIYIPLTRRYAATSPTRGEVVQRALQLPSPLVGEVATSEASGG